MKKFRALLTANKHQYAVTVKAMGATVHDGCNVKL